MRSAPTKSKPRGYSLLELSIVLVMIGMLTVIAIPGYQGYIARAHVHSAIADIGTIQLGLKRWELNTLAFPNTLAEAGLDGLLDPWGNRYEYLNLTGANPGSVRKNRNLVPINTDYDLYSKGPDGLSRPPLTAAASRDDIVRANDGDFVGLAANY